MRRCTTPSVVAVRLSVGGHNLRRYPSTVGDGVAVLACPAADYELLTGREWLVSVRARLLVGRMRVVRALEARDLVAAADGVLPLAPDDAVSPAPPDTSRVTS